MRRAQYILSLETISSTQTLRVTGYRPALRAAKALASTGNGLVLIRSCATGRARVVTA